jgi:hypothetical protein
MDNDPAMEPQESGIWDRLKQGLKLVGIVGIAAASLALSYCSHSSPKPDQRVPDLRTGPDAGPPGDAAPTGDAAVKDDKQPAKPDARLWDVLCE